MKLFSKKYASIALAPILIMLASQPTTLDFMLETYLGRIFVVALLILITANNKILGLVVVLSIIIFYNLNFVHNEGFSNRRKRRYYRKRKYVNSTTTPPTSTTTPPTSTTTPPTSTTTPPTSTTTPPTSTLVYNPNTFKNYHPDYVPVENPINRPEYETVDNEEEEEDEDDMPVYNLDIKIKKQNKAREGFCMSDRETTILKGKRPNSIPVLNKEFKQSDDVAPFETTDFTSLTSTV